MQVLTHVENALALARRVEKIAASLARQDIVDLIRASCDDIARDLARGHAHKETLPVWRARREAAFAALSRVLHDETAALVVVLGPLDPAVHSGGRALSPVERARFRLRSLQAREDDARRALARVEHTLAAALDTYDHTVDAYLAASSVAHAHLEHAVRRSQRLRVVLERARDVLMATLPPSDARARVLRRMTLRTRRARHARTDDIGFVALDAVSRATTADGHRVVDDPSREGAPSIAG